MQWNFVAKMHLLKRKYEKNLASPRTAEITKSKKLRELSNTLKGNERSHF